MWLSCFGSVIFDIVDLIICMRPLVDPVDCCILIIVLESCKQRPSFSLKEKDEVGLD